VSLAGRLARPAQNQHAVDEFRTTQRGWRAAEWLLFGVWVVAALATMYPALGRALHVYGGFFTNYAADLANPPWLYIAVRHRPQKHLLARWLGSSPGLAAGSIFLGGSILEISQLFWPNGFFAGTFDPLDFAAYGAGLLMCYLVDKRNINLGRVANIPR